MLNALLSDVENLTLNNSLYWEIILYAIGTSSLASRMAKEETLLQRIAIDPKIMLGKPVIKGTRVPVELIVKLVASGATEKEILKDYPQLTVDDIKASLLYAAKVLRNEEIYLITFG